MHEDKLESLYLIESLARLIEFLSESSAEEFGDRQIIMACLARNIRERATEALQN